MNSVDRTTRNDERSERLATLSWLLHVAGASLLLAGLGVYYLTFHAPLSAKEHHLADRVSAVTQELGHTNETREQLDDTAKLLGEQKQRAADVRKRIPDLPEEAEFLRSLSEAAAASGVLIQDFSRGAIASNETFSQIDVSLECEGTYESICRFLDQLEQIPRVARVVSMEITADSSKDCYPLLMVIRLYFGVHRPTDLRKLTLLPPARRFGFSAFAEQASIAMWPCDRGENQLRWRGRHG